MTPEPVSLDMRYILYAARWDARCGLAPVHPNHPTAPGTTQWCMDKTHAARCQTQPQDCTNGRTVYLALGQLQGLGLGLTAAQYPALSGIW